MSPFRRIFVGRILAALLPLSLLLVPSAEAQLRARVFAGTWGPGGAGQGHVERYEEGTTWTRLSPPGGLGDAAWDLEWHEGELWASTHEGPAASAVDLFLRADTPHGDLGRVFGLAATNNGKVMLMAGVTDDLIEKGLKAGDIVKEIAPIVGGGGGGRPQFAQAGGKNPEKINDALTKAANLINKILG